MPGTCGQPVNPFCKKGVEAAVSPARKRKSVFEMLGGLQVLGSALGDALALLTPRTRPFLAPCARVCAPSRQASPSPAESKRLARTSSFSAAARDKVNKQRNVL